MGKNGAKFEVITIVGARPQFVKSAALSAAFLKSNVINEKILHSGQHYDAGMSDVFFNQLGIPSPSWRLDTGGGRHGEMTGKMLIEIEQILIDNNPDMVIVFGDTNTTLAATIAAVKLSIPVAHIEAGLRSFNFYQPEEINRVMTDRVCEVLFTSSKVGSDHLKREDVQGRVETVGDIMYDSILMARAFNQKSPPTILNDLGVAKGSFELVTLHRAENVDDKGRFEKIVNHIRNHATTERLLFPIHPRTRKMAAELDVSLEGFELLEPLGYLETVALLEAAATLFTDSGGMQKEAYFCDTTCVTLRDETEWVETVEAGWNRLWTEKEFKPRAPITAYGDGTAGNKIVSVLEEYLTQKRV